MGEAIGDFLPAAVGVAISPLPIVAVVLMLAAARGRATGPAFLVGWLVGVAGVGVVVLVLASGADASDHGEQAVWVDWLKLVVGLLLLAVSIRQWRAAPIPRTSL
jgi:hypothetical protein